MRAVALGLVDAVITLLGPITHLGRIHTLIHVAMDLKLPTSWWLTLSGLYKRKLASELLQFIFNKP